ncbi:Kinase [Giardia muris]|uniref:Kinase n=1 Tax=Giardia muris TaxID=5742 RepID=A0A4Z1SSM9_GIAMU|nr:Kinase [Giardia muris]|eukprot:TNJ27995.1 Kinase [Giardia muris]
MSGGDFRSSTVLARRRHAIVLLGTATGVAGMCVAKIVNLREVRQSLQLCTVNDPAHLAELAHPNILRCFGTRFNIQNDTVTLFEEFGQVCLSKLIVEHRRAGTFFTEDAIWNLATDTLAALAYLHTENNKVFVNPSTGQEIRIGQMAHAGIKPSNIFVPHRPDATTLERGDTKLSHPALYRNFGPVRNASGRKIDELIYCSPELMECFRRYGSTDKLQLVAGQYTLLSRDHTVLGGALSSMRTGGATELDLASDLWAFGMVLCELMTLSCSYCQKHTDLSRLLTSDFQDYRSDLENVYSSDLVDFATRMVDPDPMARGTVARLLDVPEIAVRLASQGPIHHDTTCDIPPAVDAFLPQDTSMQSLPGPNDKGSQLNSCTIEEYESPIALHHPQGQPRPHPLQHSHVISTVPIRACTPQTRICEPGKIDLLTPETPERPEELNTTTVKVSNPSPAVPPPLPGRTPIQTPMNLRSEPQRAASAQPMLEYPSRAQKSLNRQIRPWKGSIENTPEARSRTVGARAPSREREGGELIPLLISNVIPNGKGDRFSYWQPGDPLRFKPIYVRGVRRSASGGHAQSLNTEPSFNIEGISPTPYITLEENTLLTAQKKDEPRRPSSLQVRRTPQREEQTIDQSTEMSSFPRFMPSPTLPSQQRRSPRMRDPESPSARRMISWWSRADALANLHSIRRDKKGNTQLILAALSNNQKAVQEHLHQAGLQNSYGYTAMMVAAKRGFANIVRMLMDREAGITTKRKSMVPCATALILAAISGQAEVVYLLHEREKGIQDKFGMTALMHAASRGYADIVLILRNVEACKRDVNGCTALFKATEANRIDIVKLLVEQEAGISTVQSYKYGAGFTSLMCAARLGYVQAVDVLTRHEANMMHMPSDRESGGWTALVWAAREGQISCIRILAPIEGASSGTLAILEGEKSINNSKAKKSKIRLLIRRYAQDQDFTDSNSQSRILRTNDI